MNRILCSTGALIGRPNGRNFRLLEDCAARLECDGFEFMLYETWYDQLDELIDYVTSLHLNIPTFHVEKQVGDRISRNEEGDVETALERFGINCRVAEAFGAKILVLHLWGGIDSDKDIEHNFSYYPQLRSTACEHGLTLTVENVVCNRQDPMTHLMTLAARHADIGFTFDTKMAAFHDQLNLLYQPENRGVFDHVRHMHINDYGGGYKEWTKLRTLHPGQGNVDFAEVFAFLKDAGYTGDFTVEATSFDQTGAIDFDALNRTFAMLRDLLEA